MLNDSQPALLLQHVEKRFGSFTALEDVYLAVERGHVHGFLGLNGAGKTTTIKLIMNFLQPTSGTVQVLGKDAYEHSTELKQSIGYLSGDFELYNNLTGQQYLEYMSHLRGMEDQSKTAELCNELEAVLDRPIRTLSRGNKQKIGLISALIGEPELLILDEPTTGLDPIMQQKFYEVVRRHADSGKTVFMSSHIISEVQEVCDVITFMRKGRVTDTVNVKELLDSKQRHITMNYEGKKIIRVPEKLHATDTTYSPGKTEFDVAAVDALLLQWLAKQKLTDLSITKTDLEKVFLMLYHEEAHV
jgi:ABC-2 type transport system ATP-binding protein